MLRLITGVGYLFTGAVLWMAPYFSRREYFFAVRVPEGFRRSPEARKRGGLPESTGPCSSRR